MGWERGNIITVNKQTNHTFHTVLSAMEKMGNNARARVGGLRQEWA